MVVLFQSFLVETLVPFPILLPKFGSNESFGVRLRLVTLQTEGIFPRRVKSPSPEKQHATQAPHQPTTLTKIATITPITG